MKNKFLIILITLLCAAFFLAPPPVAAIPPEGVDTTTSRIPYCADYVRETTVTLIRTCEDANRTNPAQTNYCERIDWGTGQQLCAFGNPAHDFCTINADALGLLCEREKAGGHCRDACTVTSDDLSTAPVEDIKFEPTLPRLQIDIPGLQPFTKASLKTTEEGDRIMLDVNFIGPYLVALYKYLVGISGIMAGIMIVWAGVKWLTSAGSPDKIGEAKKKIAGAVVGLILVLGSYIILQILNPDLVFLKPLRIPTVKRVLLETQLGTTTADTSIDVGGATPGSHTPTYSNCPFTLGSPREQRGGGARAAEFYEKVRAGGIINGATSRDRIVQIADAANVCDTNFGSCGRTAGTIFALAGVGNGGCLNPPSGNCNGVHGPAIHEISQDQRRSIYGMRCDFEGADSPKLADYKREDCVNSAGEATAKIRTYFQSEANAGRLNGWPDQWANDLRPGDYFVVYNGNKDLVGSHAVIFVGWGSDGQTAQVIQGGGAAWKTRNGTICIKSGCGDRMKPLLYIWTP